MPCSMKGKALSLMSSLGLSISRLLTGGRLEKVTTDNKRNIAIEIYANGKTYLLRLSTSRKFPHFCLQDRKFPPNKNIPVFISVLRKRLIGLRVLEVNFSTEEMLLEIKLAGRKKYSLILDIGSNTQNIYLIDEDKNTRSYTKQNREFIPSFCQTIKEKEEAIDVFTTSEEIDRYYQSIRKEEEKEKILKRLNKEKKQAVKLLSNIEADRKKLERYNKYKNYGELLKIHFHLIKKGQSQVTVPDIFSDHEGNTSLTIPLEAHLTPQKNIESFFKKYKKYKRGIDFVLKRSEEAKEKLARICQAVDSAAKGNLPPSTENIQETEKKKKEKQDKTKEFRSFRSKDGFKILVGRNDKENDKLTMVNARGNDIWLHTRDYPGSHVVIKCERKEVTNESIVDAATLAIVYSKAKKHGEGTVVYTQKKYIRKPKKAKAGSVIYSQNKEIHIKLDQSRVKRLTDNPNR